MAKSEVSAKSKVRPARDPAAPWASNAVHQRMLCDGSRAVVYCVSVEGVPLLKIGRTKHLKKRMANLKVDAGRDLHISYWAEFPAEIAKDVERCALIRMRMQFKSDGEWALAEPMFGASAIQSAAQFLGVRPEYDAGAPMDEEPEDEYADLRENHMPIKHKATNCVDRDFWREPFTVK